MTCHHCSSRMLLQVGSPAYLADIDTYDLTCLSKGADTPGTFSLLRLNKYDWMLEPGSILHAVRSFHNCCRLCPAFTASQQAAAKHMLLWSCCLLLFLLEKVLSIRFK